MVLGIFKSWLRGHGCANGVRASLLFEGLTTYQEAGWRKENWSLNMDAANSLPGTMNYGYNGSAAGGSRPSLLKGLSSLRLLLI